MKSRMEKSETFINLKIVLVLIVCMKINLIFQPEASDGFKNRLMFLIKKRG